MKGPYGKPPVAPSEFDHDEDCDCETFEQLREALEVLANCLLPDEAPDDPTP